MITVASRATFDVSAVPAYTLGSGQTLTGSGTIAGMFALGSGGHLAPGNSPGTLSFSDGLTLNNGSVLDFELGTTSDLIRVSGGMLTGAPGVNGITLNLTDSGGFAPNTYVLFDLTGATLSDFDVSDFNLGSTLAGYNYSFALSGTTFSLVATVAAIPEPSTYALIIGAGALGLVAYRRRDRTLCDGG